jgi:hypothetical protein
VNRTRSRGRGGVGRTRSDIGGHRCVQWSGNSYRHDEECGRRMTNMSLLRMMRVKRFP